MLSDTKNDVRTSQKELTRQIIEISEYTLPKHLFNAIPNAFLILNENRQIVFSNKSFLSIAEAEDINEIIGQRPGEALKCIYSQETGDGCGTSRFCEKCGANIAIRGAREGVDEFRECSLLRERGGKTEALEFNVWATPFEYKGEKFITFAIKDVSDEKRRRTLERIFFHDILNIAGGIQSYSGFLKEIEKGPLKEKISLIHDYAAQLVNEIQAQREISAAETNDLDVIPEEIESIDLLEFVSGLYREQDMARLKRIVISPGSVDVKFSSDPTILGRILGNMIKNALEAIDEGGEITVGCGNSGNDVIFFVHNDTYIPHDVQVQIFKRSFSTKGANRGLGTYSIKLLTERFLNGKVYFESAKENGTTFYAVVPSISENVS